MEVRNVNSVVRQAQPCLLPCPSPNDVVRFRLQKCHSRNSSNMLREELVLNSKTLKSKSWRFRRLQTVWYLFCYGCFDK